MGIPACLQRFWLFLFRSPRSSKRESAEEVLPAPKFLITAFVCYHLCMGQINTLSWLVCEASQGFFVFFSLWQLLKVNESNCWVFYSGCLVVSQEGVSAGCHHVPYLLKLLQTYCTTLPDKFCASWKWDHRLCESVIRRNCISLSSRWSFCFSIFYLTILNGINCDLWFCATWVASADFLKCKLYFPEHWKTWDSSPFKSWLGFVDPSDPPSAEALQIRQWTYLSC